MVDPVVHRSATSGPNDAPPRNMTGISFPDVLRDALAPRCAEPGAGGEGGGSSHEEFLRRAELLTGQFLVGPASVAASLRPALGPPGVPPKGRIVEGVAGTSLNSPGRQNGQNPDPDARPGKIDLKG